MFLAIFFASVVAQKHIVGLQSITPARRRGRGQVATCGILKTRVLALNGLRQTHDEKKSKSPSNHEISVKTVSQLAREYAVHPTQVTQWRATIRDHMPELFEPGQPGTEDQEQLIAQLHQKIGQLTVDLDWLKKKSRQLGL